VYASNRTNRTESLPIDALPGPGDALIVKHGSGAGLQELREAPPHGEAGISTTDPRFAQSKDLKVVQPQPASIRDGLFVFEKFRIALPPDLAIFAGERPGPRRGDPT